MYRSVGAEEHDDFESRTRGVDHYNRAEIPRQERGNEDVGNISKADSYRQANKEATKAVAQPRRNE